MIDAMKQALEVLERESDAGYSIECEEAITALRQAIEQAEKQEPEHWSDCAIYNEPAYHKGECDCGGYYKPIAYKEKKSDSIFYNKNNCSGDYIPLYTAPPKREQEIFIGTDLTADGMHLVIRRGNEIIHSQFYEAPKREWVGLTDEEVGKYSDRLNGGDIAREVEAKLKERNNG